MSDMNTWLDGGGVLPDLELPARTRIRFRPTEGQPALDLTVWVEDGFLVVAGPWSKLEWMTDGENRMLLRGWL